MSPSESLILIANPLQQGRVFSVRDSCIHQGEYLESPSIYIPWNAWSEIHFLPGMSRSKIRCKSVLFLGLNLRTLILQCHCISNFTSFLVNFSNSCDKQHHDQKESVTLALSSIFVKYHIGEIHCSCGELGTIQLNFICDQFLVP